MWVSLKALLKYVWKYSDILVFLYNKINNWMLNYTEPHEETRDTKAIKYR